MIHLSCCVYVGEGRESQRASFAVVTMQEGCLTSGATVRDGGTLLTFGPLCSSKAPSVTVVLTVVL